VFSIENITANNGWAMALAGAIIVMTGLSVLSLVISQLHKLAALFEKKDPAKTKAPAAAVPESPVAAAISDPADMVETAKLYQAAAGELGREFDLRQLYAMAAQKQMPHPHLSIRSMREAGIIVPAGDGLFTWA
jgi:hypothetical protein